MNEVDFQKISREDLDWLIGLYIADGSKLKEKQRQYRIHFYLNPKKDELILKKLLNILISLNLNPNIQLKEKIGTLFIRVTNKMFFEKLPYDKSEKYVPKNIEAFIAGFLDGDGYVNKKEVGFSQTIAKWIGPFIVEYLEKKGVNIWTKGYYRNAFYFRASVNKVKEKTNIIRFMAKAGN